MILLLASLVAAAPPQVVVSSLQTDRLVEDCRGKDTDADATFCTGYILGAFDTLSLAHQICPSAAKGSTLDAVATTRKYLRTHTEKSGIAPAFVVRDALGAAFPCQRGKPGRPSTSRHISG